MTAAGSLQGDGFLGCQEGQKPQDDAGRKWRGFFSSFPNAPVQRKKKTMGFPWTDNNFGGEKPQPLLDGNRVLCIKSGSDGNLPSVPMKREQSLIFLEANERECI